jgi:hypothetical protein
MKYTIKTSAKRNMFGKRTGKFSAGLMADDSGVAAYEVEADTATDAKDALINALGVLADHQYKRRYLFCGDGRTILIVYMTASGACYDIIDDERAHASGCMTSQSFDACVKAAEAHAESSYGGVRHKLS